MLRINSELIYNRLYIGYFMDFFRSKELGFTQWTLTFVAFTEPLHYTISMEFFVTSLTGLLG